MFFGLSKLIVAVLAEEDQRNAVLGPCRWLEGVERWRALMCWHFWRSSRKTFGILLTFRDSCVGYAPNSEARTVNTVDPPPQLADKQGTAYLE